MTRFVYDLSGTANHRDAQVRHALIRLLHWAQRHDLSIAIEDLDFSTEKTREKHGRQKRFRQVISGMPVSKLRARLVSMAAELGIPIIAVDPAYTSRWGAQHWRKPLQQQTSDPVTRHHAAAVAIGRRGLGVAIRRRPAGPRSGQRTAAGTSPARPDPHQGHGGRRGSSGPPTHPP